jgi:hypothetical protein
MELLGHASVHVNRGIILLPFLTGAIRYVEHLRHLPGRIGQESRKNKLIIYRHHLGEIV